MLSETQVCTRHSLCVDQGSTGTIKSSPVTADKSDWKVLVTADKSDWKVLVTADKSDWKVLVTADKSDWKVLVTADKSDWKVLVSLSPLGLVSNRSSRLLGFNTLFRHLKHGTRYVGDFAVL